MALQNVDKLVNYTLRNIVVLVLHEWIIVTLSVGFFVKSEKRYLDGILSLVFVLLFIYLVFKVICV